MDPKRKGGPDLAIIFGGKPGKPSSKPGPDTEDREHSDDNEDDELPPGFEAAAIEVFPDFEGDHERLVALKRLIALCTGSYDDE